MELVPEWREFTPEDKKMMKLDYDSQLIDIPNKERMERMRAILLKSRDRRAIGDSPAPQPATGKYCTWRAIGDSAQPTAGTCLTRCV